MKLQRTHVFLAVGCLAALSIAAAHTGAAKTPANAKTTPKLSRRLHKLGVGGSFPITIYAAQTATDNTYSVAGNAQGQVIVTNVATGNVVQTLQMDADVPVRQVFLLTNDQTVGAAQKDHTIFWNIATGNQIAQVNEEVYGFSCDRTLFFSCAPQMRSTYPSGAVNMYSYPAMQQLGQLETDMPGPATWNFSPDNHYLVVQYNGMKPAADANYPDPAVSDSNIQLTHYYDLTTFQEFLALSLFENSPVGSFSADSTTYSFNGEYFDPGNSNVQYTSSFWQYTFLNSQLTPLN